MKVLTPIGGTKTVAAAGTAVALAASSTKAITLTIVAKSTNTNPVHIGDSSVHNSTSPQIALAAGGTFSLVSPEGLSIDLAEWYVDAQTNGEGVGFLYTK